MSEFDVVVIGAGAAGLAAGERLLASGRRFAVLEARQRPGGRAWTDFSIFGGIPFDRGCHWIHSASRNPFLDIARRLGHHVEPGKTRRSRQIYLGTTAADAETARAAWDAVEAAFAAAEAAGNAGRDVAASEVCDTAGPWWQLARHWMTLLSSLPPEEISTLDLSRYHDTHENWPVAGGYGALVVRAAAAVPVHLGTVVTGIDYSRSPIRVTTERGTLTAGAVIITASTNVLSSGAIRFSPGLPPAHGEALAACPVGVAEKVAFLLDRPLEGIAPTSYVDTLDPGNRERSPINFTLNPFGHPMAVGQLAGENARVLEAEGESSMIAFGLAALKEAFGSDIARRIKVATATHWVSDPFVRGGYSCALPGQADLRRLLREPIGDRVFLAGEAVSDHAFSTAHGARQSGLAAADRALAVLS